MILQDIKYIKKQVLAKVSGLRNGDKAIDDLTLKTTEKLYTFFKEEMNN